MRNSKFIPLPNIVGTNGKATDTTVALFNTSRPIEQDNKGEYIWKAIEPHLNGVITVKEYNFRTL